MTPLTVQEVDVEDESVKKAEVVDESSVMVTTVMTVERLYRNVEIIIVVCREEDIFETRQSNFS